MFRDGEGDTPLCVRYFRFGKRSQSGLTAKEEVEAERRGKREGTTGEGPAAKLRGTVAPALKEPGDRGRRRQGARRQEAQEAGDVKECLSRENS